MLNKKNQKKIVALIPARSGSKRIKDKNILKLKNHPLLAYSIQAAKKSNLFSKVKNRGDWYLNYHWLIGCLFGCILSFIKK